MTMPNTDRTCALVGKVPGSQILSRAVKNADSIVKIAALTASQVLRLNSFDLILFIFLINFVTNKITAMIKANELRLGNWVSNGDPVRVQFFMLNPIYGDCVDYDPIPLTPEILEKCGFVLNNSVLWNEPFWCFESSPAEIMLGEDICLENVKNLHQLQNVFFAITGKELEITSLATTL